MALCVPKCRTRFFWSLALVMRDVLYFVFSNIVCSGSGSSFRIATNCIIIYIYIFINCNLVVTLWQWLFYMYTKYEIGY